MSSALTCLTSTAEETNIQIVRWAVEYTEVSKKTIYIIIRVELL